jgi:hypothetical protein
MPQTEWTQTEEGKATAKTEADVLAVVARVRFDKKFRVGHMGDGFFVQIEYWETDVVTHEPALQRGRKWYVSTHATDSEIVQTMLTAALASAEHQVREHFFYAGPCPKCKGTGSVEMLDGGLMPRPKDVPLPTAPCDACEGKGTGRPRAIYGPHFSADALYGICGKRANYDAREDPE